MTHLKQDFEGLARDLGEMETEARQLAAKAKKIAERFRGSLKALDEERRRHGMTSDQGECEHA